MIIFLEIAAFRHFADTHFLWNTIIDDVDCTFLTLEKAIEKIKAEGIDKTHIFSYQNNSTGQSFWSDFGFEKRDDVFVFSYNNK